MSKVILNVEDDDAAYRLLQIAFEEVLPLYKLYRAKDGAEALLFIKKIAPFHHVPTPNLVFLNLNLPKVNGDKVLEEMGNDIALKNIPVVVFSSSALSQDRARCLALGACHYITKPGDYLNLLEAVQEASAFATA